MTTYLTEDVTCAACGTASEQNQIASTNSFGPPDLDLRPPEMKRSTMGAWLQECPACGFVSPDISRSDEGVRDFMAAGGLARPAAEGRVFAQRCLRRSSLDERLGDLQQAAERMLWAAWDADDAGSKVAADYRSRAAALFGAAAARLPPDSPEATLIRVRMIDVLRRAGRWSDAIGVADDVLGKADLEPILRSVAAFGRQLAQAEDGGRRTVADVQAEAPQS